MYILGIHTGASANASIVEDDNFLAFCKEESISRIKDDGCRFNLMCIDDVIASANIKRDKIGLVIISAPHLPKDCISIDKNNADILERFNESSDTVNLLQLVKGSPEIQVSNIINTTSLQKRLGLSKNCQILIVDNLKSHILSTNNFIKTSEPILHICCDYNKNFPDTKIYYSNKESFSIINTKKLSENNGIACFWDSAINLLGVDFDIFTDYANQGENRLGNDLYDFFSLEDGVIVNINNLDFSDVFAQFATKLTVYDFAASIQYAIEKVMKDFFLYWIEKTQVSRISLSGSLFLNPSLNAMVASLENIKDIYTSPINHTSYLSVGNCLFGHLAKFGNNINEENIKNIYCGKAFPIEILEGYIEKYKFSLKRHSDVPTVVSMLISNNYIGAVLCENIKNDIEGKLVNSIIATPHLSTFVELIYERLGQLEGTVFNTIFLKNDFQASGMNLKTFNNIPIRINEDFKTKTPLIVRADDTVLAKIIENEESLLVYIMKKYYEFSGGTVLINKELTHEGRGAIRNPLLALKLLSDGKIDFIAYKNGLIFKDGF